MPAPAGTGRYEESTVAIVRPYVEGDADGVAVLVDQLGYEAMPWDVTRRAEALVSSPSDALLVADDDGAVVGWVHVCGVNQLQQEPFAEIVALVVSEGNRTGGVGGRLLEEAEAWAAANGYATLRLRSNVVRTDAHAFYRRRGYMVEKEQAVFVKDL